MLEQRTYKVWDLNTFTYQEIILLQKCNRCNLETDPPQMYTIMQVKDNLHKTRQDRPDLLFYLCIYNLEYIGNMYSYFS